MSACFPQMLVWRVLFPGFPGRAMPGSSSSAIRREWLWGIPSLGKPFGDYCNVPTVGNSHWSNPAGGNRVYITCQNTRNGDFGVILPVGCHWRLSRLRSVARRRWGQMIVRAKRPLPRYGCWSVVPVVCSCWCNAGRNPHHKPDTPNRSFYSLHRVPSHLWPGYTAFSIAWCAPLLLWQIDPAVPAGYLKSEAISCFLLKHV